MAVAYEVVVRRTGPYRGFGDCPLDDCPTMLQPLPEGTLRDGVLAHLSVVHKIKNRKVVLK